MFFKVLLVVLGVYFLIKLIFRSIISWFLGNTVKKANQQSRQQQDEMSRQKKKKDGHVTVHYHPKSEKNFGKDDGDYVDFEEVK